MEKLKFAYRKKSISKLIVFLLIINSFLFTDAWFNQSYAAPVINEMNVDTTDNEVSVSGTGDGNGVPLADKPFRYSIGSSQSDWVRDSSNITINETLTSGALSNTQVTNNSLTLGPATVSGGSIETTTGGGLEGYAYGKVITIDHTKVDSELTNFPATVYLNSTNFDFSKCKPDGSDIRFTDKDLNPLKFERVEHSDVTQTDTYKAGAEYTALTGGWGNQSYDSTGTHTFTKNTGNMTMTTSNSNQRIRSTNTIDVTAYTKVCVKYSTTTNNASAAENLIAIGLTDIASDSTDVSVASYMDYYSTVQTDVVRKLDISNITGSHYVAIRASALHGNVTNTVTITEIWFEDANGFACYNVLLPTVGDLQDTDFYMWYGNPNAYNDSIEAWQDQTGKQLTYNGNVKLVPNAAKFGKAAYFDGNGDYLSVPDSDDWNFGNGDFTIDCRFNPLNYSTSLNKVIASQYYYNSGCNNCGWILILNNGSIGYNTFYYSTTGTNSTGIVFNFQFNANTIYHLAVVRYGNTISIYIDGKLAASQACTDTFYNSSRELDIGYSYVNGNSYNAMALDELRISKGIARWTSEFAPPAEPYTIDEYTKLLMHFDNFDAMRIATSMTGTDCCYFTKTTSVNTAKTSAVKAKLKLESSGTSGSQVLLIGNGTKYTQIRLESGSIVCNDGGTNPFTYSIDTSIDNEYEIRLVNTTSAEFYANGTLIKSSPYSELATYATSDIWFGDAWVSTGSGGSAIYKYVKYNLDPVGTSTAWVEWNPTQGLPTANGWTVNGTASLATQLFKDETSKATCTYGDVKPIKTAYADGTRGANFNGTNSYFCIPNSADFNFANEDFTMRFKVRRSSFGADQRIVGKGSNDTSGTYNSTNSLLALFDVTNKPMFYFYSGSSYVTATGNAVSDMDIHDVEIVKNGNALKIAVDGIFGATADVTGKTMNTTSDVLNIGKGMTNTYSYFGGDIVAIEIAKGIARHTSNFTPSANYNIDQYTVFCTNFDTIYDQNYSMVQHMGNSLIDATGNANNPTAVSGTTVVNSSYGNARQFNGTSDYIALSNKVLTPGPKTMLIHGKPATFTGNAVPFSNHNQAGAANGIYMRENAGKLQLLAQNNNTVVINVINATSLSTLTDTVFGFKESGTTIANGVKMYVNGNVDAQGTATGTEAAPSQYLTFGCSGDGYLFYNGLLYEARSSNIERSNAWIKAESLSLKNELLTLSMYAPTGTRESEAYDISGYVTSSRIDWTQTVPTGTSIAVESNVSLDGGSSWLGWKSCTNGAIITDLVGSTDTSNARLKLRQTLSTSSSAITPILSNSIITIGMRKYVHRIAAEPNKEYTVRFDVKDANGSITTETRTVYTKAQTPQFNVIGKTINSVDLLFTDMNPGNTEYQILCDSRYVNSSGVLTSVPTWITLDDKEITVLGLNIGTMYNFTAKSRNFAEEETDYASPIYTGTEGIPVPSGSAVIAATALNNSVTVAWNGIPNSLSYELEIDGVVKNVGLKTYYVHEGLMTGTQHTYRVRGKNLGGYSEWSEFYTITTTSNPPLIPTNVIAKASDDTVTVYWDTAQDALTYTLEIGGTQITNVKKNSACLFGLAPETSYIYKVKSINLVGESEWTAEGTITTYYLETPNINLEETDSHQIKIGWTKIEGATSYRIALDANDNFDTLSGSELDEFASSSAITYIHGDLPIKTAHVYRVQALSAEGDSAWSDAITLETLPQRPDVPANFRGSASNDFITLIWDAVLDAIGYDIEVDGIVVENDDVTEYQYKGLDQYTPHTYRVRAVTDEIESLWSKLLTISTVGGVPDEPKNVVITNSRGIAALNWDKTFGAQYYDVEVGGAVYGNIPRSSFTHRQIELITSSSSIYTETAYRIRAGNDLGKSDWTDTYVNNAIKGQIERGKELDLGLAASNITDFSRYTLYVNYNADALTVTDLCAYSVEKELAPGMVEGHDIEIVSFVPGHIVFRINKIVDEGYLWTGIINNVKFTGNATGGTTLSYTAQCVKD